MALNGLGRLWKNLKGSDKISDVFYPPRRQAGSS